MRRNQLLARFEEYLVGVGMAPATIANYLADIRDFTEWYKDSGVAGSSVLQASAEQIRRYCRGLRRQGRSVSTTNRRLQAVRKFYDFARHIDLTSHNPARDVERLNGRSLSSPRILTNHEVGALLRAVGDGGNSLARRDRAMLLLLLETGLRVGELIDLRVDDLVLNVGNGYVLVGQGLASGGRCLAIGSEACAALRACLRTRAPAPGVDHLFVTRQGRPLSVRSIQRLVSNYAQIAGLEGVSVNTLRQTFAHDVLQEVEDLSDVARILGLRDVASVRRYLG